MTAMNPLENSLQQRVDRFLQDPAHDMGKLYQSYTWKKDTHKLGFPDLFRLEKDISSAARQNSLGIKHLINIAKWGKLPNTKQISWPEPKKLQLYIDHQPAMWLTFNPGNAIATVEGQIHGFGPTYASKLLHFAVPQIFGAIDTRLVRTFGEGDKASQRYQFLNLSVKWSGDRWAIPTYQSGWADEYGKWICILNYIANTLNKNGTRCDHPPEYVQAGLREKGIWLPADVETALFSYASQKLEEKKHSPRTII